MVRILTLALLGCLASHVSAGDWQPIFNGQNLDDWVVEGAAEVTVDGQKVPSWFVRDGVLATHNRSFGFLRYARREFADFELALEYRMERLARPDVGQCNSGIGIRTCPFDPRASIATRPSFHAYEIQLLDDAGHLPDEHGSGSLYRYVPPRANTIKPAGEWNQVEISCRGPRIQITINHRLVLDCDQSTDEAIKYKPLKGYINLQSHGPSGIVEFRNLRVREL